jgi:hypothetical protein
VPQDAYPAARRSERIHVSIPVTIIVEFEGKKVGHPSYLIDVSERGVKVKANVPVTLGQIVEVIPTGGPRYSVRSRVVWVGKAGSEQEGRLGLEFLEARPTTAWGLATDPRRFN